MAKNVHMPYFWKIRFHVLSFPGTTTVIVSCISSPGGLFVKNPNPMHHFFTGLCPTAIFEVIFNSLLCGCAPIPYRTPTIQQSGTQMHTHAIPGSKRVNIKGDNIQTWGKGTGGVTCQANGGMEGQQHNIGGQGGGGVLRPAHTHTQTRVRAHLRTRTHTPSPP